MAHHYSTHAEDGYAVVALAATFLLVGGIVFLVARIVLEF